MYRADRVFRTSLAGALLLLAAGCGHPVALAVLGPPALSLAARFTGDAVERFVPPELGAPCLHPNNGLGLWVAGDNFYTRRCQLVTTVPAS